MMIHKHLLRYAALCILAFGLSGCELEPYIITQEEAYTRAFVKKFGLIDPEHDWNMAQRKNVTVDIDGTAKSVKVYAEIDQKYYIVADYKDVSGKESIPFDVPANAGNVMVKVDGTPYYTTIGGTVKATAKPKGSRTALSTSGLTLQAADNEYYTVSVEEADYEVFNSMQMSPILKNGKWDDYISLNGRVWRYNNPPENYLRPTTDTSVKGNGLVPEGVNNTQNDGITQNFTITPKDRKFTIYPMYWQTDLKHELGVYLIDKVTREPIKDASGKILRFPVYLDKDGGNLQVYLKNDVADPRITLNPDHMEMHVGQQRTVTATTSADISRWYSNSGKASVEMDATQRNKAVVTALSPGVATIGVVSRNNNETANCCVVIRQAYMEITDKKLEMTPGATAQLTLRYPYDETLKNQAKTWTSDNPRIATVSSDGLVTAVAGGTTNIKCTCDGTTSTCTVIVAAAEATNIKMSLSHWTAPDWIIEHFRDNDGVWSNSATIGGTTYTLKEGLAEYLINQNNLSTWFNALPLATRRDMVKATQPSNTATVVMNSQGVVDLTTYTAVSVTADWGGDVNFFKDGNKPDNSGWNNVAINLTLNNPSNKPVRRTPREVYEDVDEPMSRAGEVELPEALQETNGRWINITNSNESYRANTTILCRSKGVTINLGDFDGEVGMYIKVKDGPNQVNQNDVNVYEDDAFIYYSQSTLNTHWADKPNSYACSFKHPVSGRLFFSFEDWANAWGNSDMDLNDLVFLLKEVKQVASDDGDDIIIEDEPYPWLLAIEDLGSTDDFDFNDLVVGISSVTVNSVDSEYPIINDPDHPTAGYSKVTLRALAAGGVLRVWLYYRNQKLAPEGTDDGGEWHKWFGNHINHGQMLNTGLAYAAPRSYSWYIQNFSMPDIWKQNPDPYINSNSSHNFKVAVEEPTNTNINSVDRFEMEGTVVHFVQNNGHGSGGAPQMFLVPGDWKWPIERTAIGVAYPRFKDWVISASGSTDWWKTPASTQAVVNDIQ